MAASSSRFPVYEPEVFYKSFPHLDSKNHKPASRATPQPGKVTRPYQFYNCFAFIVGDKKRFWWPEDPHSYWPDSKAKESVEELIRVLKELGYELCKDGSYEKGVTKVAIFVNGDLPVHVAIQPSNRCGIWKSKMAFNIDMEHDLHAIESWENDLINQGFGTAKVFMRYKRKSSR